MSRLPSPHLSEAPKSGLRDSWLDLPALNSHATQSDSEPETIHTRSKLARLVRIYPIVFGIWTLAPLLFASQGYVDGKFNESARSGEQLLRNSLRMLVSAYTYAFITPYFVLALWSFRLSRSWVRNVLMHLGPALLYCALYLAIIAAIRTFFPNLWDFEGSYLDNVRIMATSRSANSMLWFMTTVSIVYALRFSQESREKRLRASRLEARLAQTQLQILRMQLQPHFLFNTLNAVTALMRKNVDAAEEMIASLSELMRHTLDSAGKQEVALRDEIRFIDHYLSIEAIRLGDRLTVTKHIDSEVYDALIPNLMLQPLVENAIRHGIAPRLGEGSIDVRIRRVDETLVIDVMDDGLGAKASSARSGGSGVGIKNTRQRLLQLFGKEHEFGAAARPEGGYAVHLEIPFRLATSLSDT